MAWPSSLPYPSNIKRVPKKAQLKGSFDAGYVASVAKFTRTRILFDLSWNILSHADYLTLETYFKNNLGSTFTWTDPTDSTAYTVRFSDDHIEANHIGAGYWEVSVNLEEQ